MSNYRCKKHVVPRNIDIASVKCRGEKDRYFNPPPTPRSPFHPLPVLSRLSFLLCLIPFPPSLHLHFSLVPTFPDLLGAPRAGSEIAYLPSEGGQAVGFVSERSHPSLSTPVNPIINGKIRNMKTSWVNGKKGCRIRIFEQ